ncbi:hypothetical protein MuYL_4106 [Mucilaginibacter xinganensis]|uniref:Uncharacterized protein n=1 Tax=Mucilaginibacter xinganensis TaxID=1234841 RepID=A0A223P2E0_9SPHI|nr:hypothetical protein MuYL_4106 [Mucilaginibacter xinganensis]
MLQKNLKNDRLLSDTAFRLSTIKSLNMKLLITAITSVGPGI